MKRSYNATTQRGAMMALPILAFVLGGCAATPRGSLGPDIDDFNEAAKTLVNKMLVSQQFSEAVAKLKASKAGEKPLVCISRIKNDTTEKVDMRGFLVDPMEEVLNESGKVCFFAEDPTTQENAKGWEILTGRDPKLADFTLYGTVRDLRTTGDDVMQAAYVFHLRMAGREASTVWQGQTQIIKQRKRRPGFGL